MRRHTPYIMKVIAAVECPHCGAPKGRDCSGTITHQTRIMAASTQGVKAGA